MRIRHVLIAGLASLALIGSALAQTNTGRSGGQFLKISPSARGVAFGGAYGAVAQDADAVFSNPAGLTHLRGLGVHLSHISYVADINFNYAVVAMPLAGGVVGVQFGSMTTASMPVTTIEDPTNSLGITFDVSSWVAGISYATSLTDRLSLGVTGKYARETIWDMTSGTMTFDVGTLYYTGFSNWRFAAILQNFGPSGRFKGGHLVTQYNKFGGDQSETVAEDRSDSYDVPLTFRLATAYDFDINDRMVVTSSLEGAHPNDSPESLSGGLEYSYNLPAVSVALRAGYRVVGTQTVGTMKDLRLATDAAVLGVGVGVPFIAKKLAFDYTWQDYQKLGVNHLFSLSMNF